MADEVTPGTPRVPWSRRAQLWRSPADQPAWARPFLLVVAALAALSYSWDVGSTIEIYYAAAVRSMSQSWHDFLFGAFDPAGTVTVDKLPGSMWVQALSARIFGFHEWAVLAPSAVEGALTVLVLYHCVRRLGGPLAGLGAVVVLAASPATVTLNRGNIPDSLTILLLVLAADATVSAILNDRWLSAVLAALYVALAFQAKMVEAWLVLPALGLAYLVAGRGSTAHRMGRLVAMGATVAVVSLSYMTFVALTPASQRPYADGSPNNSVYHQVFVYNGFNRVGQASPNELLGQTLGTRLFSQAEPPPVWNRLFAGSYGRDTGWLLLAALAAFAWILVQRRRAPRTDLVRVGALLWGVWLVVLGVVFTVSTTMNSYYAGALSPAVAGLLGLGGALAWEHRHESGVLLGTAGVVLITTGYTAWLLPTGGTGQPSWLTGAVVALGLAAAAVLVGLAVAGRRGHRAVVPAAVAVGGVLAVAAVLLVPAAASASVVAEGLGPFDTPFQPDLATEVIHGVFAPPPATLATLGQIEQVRRGAPYLMATQTSAVAAEFIYDTGEEVLPLGGYTGTIPSPTASATAALVAAKQFHLALVASPGATPGAAWVVAHCLHVSPHAAAPGPAPRLKIYYCLPKPVAGR
ncbi:MAG TPA: glycosyltransferase family 39 protein [Acidimicrobiales bacterium]|nr:glycosyltransferase family 39 protein [Acidimicrobiales bacterium]